MKGFTILLRRAGQRRKLTASGGVATGGCTAWGIVMAGQKLRRGRWSVRVMVRMRNGQLLRSPRRTLSIR